LFTIIKAIKQAIKKVIKKRLNTSMSYTITIQHTGSKASSQFTCNPDQTILDAALAAGLVLPYGCKNGACGSCKAPLNEGQVQHSHDNATVKTALSEGAALLCCARPLSDAQFTSRVAKVDADYPLKKLPTRIASITKAADDVRIVHLQLPAAEKLAFKAGQYLEFILRDGSRRAYSMGNAPHSLTSCNQLELHIRHMPGGLFTDALFGIEASKLAVIKEKDIMRIEVPQGTFFLREESQKPMIMLASGTGFAPIKAIIEQSIEKGLTRPITLYWGGRALKDLYLHELAQSWAATHSHIRYVPVLSDVLDGWAGRTGFVHQAVMTDVPNMADFEVYACGAPIVVSSAQTDFVAKCHLPAEAFFADSFTSAADGA
jgi:CDP-4-dehydro-6-deoxyglucose reductase